MVAKVTYKSASVTLRPLPSGTTVWVANLYAEERRQGHATELMKMITAKADAQDIILQLDARAYGHLNGMNTGELIIFYESFGFVAFPSRARNLMQRRPNPVMRLYCSVPGHREGWLNEDTGTTFWCPDCEAVHDVFHSQE